MKRFACVCLFLSAAPAWAQSIDRCRYLDTSNPALTQGVIPIHGAPQGVVAYTSPAEWPYASYQLQWMGSDGVMRHAHMEVCAPLNGEVAGPVVIPFRLQTFLESGQIAWGVGGPFVRSVVYESATQPVLANGSGVSIVLGHLTIDPMQGGLNQNGNGISQAFPHGFTNAQVSWQYRQANGDLLVPAGYIPLFTTYDPTAPVAGRPIFGVYNGLYTLPSGPDRGTSWGVQAAEMNELPPIFAPFNTLWPLPTLVGYTYASSCAGCFQTGTLEIKADVNLHQGDPGRLLHVVTNTTGKYLDPAEIGPGRHNIFVNWTTSSGSNGIPGAAMPNEMLTSVLEFTVTVGDDVPPPPPPGPLDCVVGPWGTTSTTTTDTPAVTVGSTQTRTETTVKQQLRSILTQPSEGGAACPTN